MISYNHDAIYRAYPNCCCIDDGTEEVLDADGKQITLDQAKIDAAAAEIAAESAATKYQRDRRYEYPDMTVLADALYWSSKGDNTKIDAYYAACEAVKTKYPKP